MERNVYFRRNLIIVLSIIILLAISVDLTRSQFLYQKSNHSLANDSIGSSSDSGQIIADEFDKLSAEKYLIIYNPMEEASETLKDNVAQTIRYMKKEVQEIKSSDLDHVSKDYDTIVIAQQDLSNIRVLDELMRYMEQGGHLFFATTPAVNDALYRIYRKLGILELGNYVDSIGIKLQTNLLIQGKGQTFKEAFLTNSSLFVQLDKKTVIHATSNQNNPMIWENRYGQGKSVVFNGTMLGEKANRGLIAGALAQLGEDFMYPIVNMKIAFIDDFPAPFYNVVNKELYKQYNRTVPAFYRDIWWPDILTTAKKYNLKYTGVLIETYNDRVEPPFDDPKGTIQSSLIIYGRELLKNGGEIGLHGYNHQSFANSREVTANLGYKPWLSRDNMIASLENAKAYMDQTFPNFQMHTYVPPSNVLSSEGREAIKQVFPDMKIVSSVYHEDFAEGIAYVQEFGVAKDGIIEMPRLSSGYGMGEADHWAIMNAINSIGVFSHFIHPDDVTDPDRNGDRTWAEMYKDYNGMMDRIEKDYPWLRSMTATEGGVETTRYTNEKVKYVHTKDGIQGYCKDYAGEAYFVLRTDKKIGSLKNCSVEKLEDGIYVVRVKQAKFEIRLG